MSGEVAVRQLNNMSDADLLALITKGASPLALTDESDGQEAG